MRLASGWIPVAALAICGSPALAAQSEPIAVRPANVLSSSDSTADSTDAPPPPVRKPAPPNCWRAQPRPPCTGFFLTEIGVEAPIRSTQVADRATTDGATRGPRSDIRERVVWTFGFMGTRGASSQGGSVSFTTEETLSSRVPFALEYRYRRWLPGRSALDVSAGYREMRIWKDGAGFRGGRGVTAMAGYTLNSYVGVSLRGDLIRAHGRARRALHVGIRSTRASEKFLKLVAIGLARAALAAIGLEVDEDEEEAQGSS